MSVVGVDGCRGGWIAVERTDTELDAYFSADLRSLVERVRRAEVAALAIDMPIGLLNRQPRVCDTEARRILGPRRSSVFPTPVRATLKATDYRHACELSRASSGKALSKQAFNLLPKIAELDDLITPADQDRVVEAHPECAFVRLAGQPLTEPKRTSDGQAMRRELLATSDPAFADLIADRRDLPLLDLIDAAVLTVTACHVVTGTEHRLGSDIDPRGLRAEVVY